MPGSPIPWTNWPRVTVLSGDEDVPLLQGGTNKLAKSAQLAFGSTSTISFSSLTVGALEVTSSATIEALTVSSNILGLNAIFQNLAALSTATFAAATVSSNFSALNSSFTTLTVSGSATFSSSVRIGVLTVSGSATFSSSISVLSASLATLAVSSNVTLGSSASTLTLNQTAMTRPNMPAFLVNSSGTTTNVTGDNSFPTVIFGEKVFDLTNSYSTATGSFTAPVPGIYDFSGNVMLQGFTSNHTVARVNVGIPAVRVFSPGWLPISSEFLTQNLALHWSVTTAMTSGQALMVTTQVTGSSSGIDIAGQGSSSPLTWFAGYLVG